MFKSILIPTDGSEFSERAAAQGIALAKGLNAKVVGFYAIPAYHLMTLNTEMTADTPGEYDRDAKARATKYLAKIDDMARAAGVPCESFHDTGAHPYEAIIKAAKSRNCDSIAMASHGRRGIQGLLLASQTNLVLTHSKIPVIVFR